MKTWQIAELKNLILISEMPPMCELVWLPTFESEEASQKWNGSNGKEPYPVLARWHCAHCGGWHHWSGAETGNNGERLAGSFAIPERILKHIPREGILVPLDSDAGYIEATRRQGMPSATRDLIMAGKHPKQTKEARSFAKDKSGF